ncbi:MAG TPA: DinB family protein [Pyrinomonadaceae bacterium]|jgi:hypothetical protein
MPPEEMMTPEELLSLSAFLAQTPERVRQLVGQLCESDARLKPSPQEFSALEQVCHLNDLEREGYGVRIEKLLSEEAEPFLEDFDGGRIAQERDYNTRQLAPMLEAFKSARTRNLLALAALSPADFERRGTLEAVGPITLAALLVKMREHDEGHLEELTALHHQLLSQ